MVNNSFTIIVPIYNVNPIYLDRITTALKKQNYSNYEVILIDDCSNDNNTLNWLKNIKHNFVTIRNKKNIGLGMTRNIGIKKAKNDFIIFIDPDDYVDENFLKNIDYEIRKNEKYDVYHYNFYYEKDKLGYKNIKKIHLWNINLYTQTSWSFALRKKFLLQNKIFFLDKKIIHEDEYFILLLLSKTNNIYLINEELYFYNICNNSSITKSNNILNKIKNINEIISCNININQNVIYYLNHIYYYPWHYMKNNENVYNFFKFNKQINYFKNKMKPYLKEYFQINSNYTNFIRKLWLFIRYSTIFSFFLFYFFLLINKIKKSK